MLHTKGAFQVDFVGPTGPCKPEKSQPFFISKPTHADSIAVKEKFIYSKYAEKTFIQKHKDRHLLEQQIWEAVRANDKKSVYRLIVNTDADVKVSEQVAFSSLTLAKVMSLQEQASLDYNSNCLIRDSLAKSPLCYSNVTNTSECSMEDVGSCSLLHLACETADIGMLELLLQYGANVNAYDSRGRLPLHRCILRGKATFVKLLLARGADPHATTREGRTPYELAVESNSEDNEVLALLSDSNG